MYKNYYFIPHFDTPCYNVISITFLITFWAHLVYYITEIYMFHFIFPMTEISHKIQLKFKNSQIQ